MKTQTEKLNVRDFVTIAILTVVELAVYFVIGMPLGSTPLSWIFCLGIQALPLGIVFMLMYTKVNKKGTVLISGLLLAALLLMSLWMVSLCVAAAAIIENYLGEVRPEEILHYADLLYHPHGRLVCRRICPADFAQGYVYCQPSHYGRI